MPRWHRRGFVWDYAGKMELTRYFWDAAVALKPEDIERDEVRRFPICNPRPLKELFEHAGLENVQVRAIDVSTIFQDFDDYWTPFLGGNFLRPIMRCRWTPMHAPLYESGFRAHLPIAPTGSIALIARAWAVRGTRTSFVG